MMYSYGATGMRPGGLLQRLASMVPALSSMPWSLTLNWHPGIGLTASLGPGAGALFGGIPPLGAGAYPYSGLSYLGAPWSAAMPYVQGAVSPLGALAPMGVYPMGALPYASGTAALAGMAPWSSLASASALAPLSSLASDIAYAPYGALQ